jgi:hypothetical protein
MIENMLGESWIKPFEIFLILVLVAVGIHYSEKTPLKSIGKAYLERACTNGGFTKEDIDAMKNEIAKNNIDPNQVGIDIQPAEALNSTNTKYAKRSTIISLNLTNNKLGLIDSLYKKLGSTTDIKNSVYIYGMSERR